NLWLFVKFKPEILWKNPWKTAVALSLPLQVLLLQLAAAQPAWVEQFYTGSVYKYLSQFLRFAFGWFPLPFGQFLFYSLVAGVLIWIAGLIRKLLLRRFGKKQFALTFSFGGLAIISAFYFLFNAMWGLNYYRKPLQEIVQIDTSGFSQTELEALSTRLIFLTNQNRR